MFVGSVVGGLWLVWSMFICKSFEGSFMVWLGSAKKLVEIRTAATIMMAMTIGIRIFPIPRLLVMNQDCLLTAIKRYVTGLFCPTLFSCFREVSGINPRRRRLSGYRVILRHYFTIKV